MRVRWLQVLASALVACTIMVPATALAAEKAPKTSGVMVREGMYSDYYPAYYGQPLRFRWQWVAIGADGTRPASGTLRYSVMLVTPDGGKIIESAAWQITDVWRQWDDSIAFVAQDAHDPSSGFNGTSTFCITPGSGGALLQQQSDGFWSAVATDGYFTIHQ